MFEWLVPPEIEAVAAACGDPAVASTIRRSVYAWSTPRSLAAWLDLCAACYLRDAASADDPRAAEEYRGDADRCSRAALALRGDAP